MSTIEHSKLQNQIEHMLVITILTIKFLNIMHKTKKIHDLSRTCYKRNNSSCFFVTYNKVNIMKHVLIVTVD